MNARHIRFSQSAAKRVPKIFSISPSIPAVKRELVVALQREPWTQRTPSLRGSELETIGANGTVTVISFELLLQLAHQRPE